MNKLRLQTRMLLATILLISAVTLCLDVSGIYIIKSYMLDRFKGRITFLAKYLAVNSEVGVLIRDRAGLNSLAVNLLGEEDVARVIILDSDDQVLVEQSKNISGRLFTVETVVKLNKTDDETLLFKEYSNTPFGTLTIAGVENIGRVRLQYSTRGINRLINEVTKQFVWISILLTTVAGILFYFIVRTLVVDITKLAIVSKMIGGGDLELRARLGNLPETRELASAFNSMLDSLERSRNAYERITKEAAQQRSLAELGKFSLSVAHEVKNPLAIIKSAFEFLKKEYDISSKNTMADYIDDEIKRLNRLIEDFLLFAKPGNIIFDNVCAEIFMTEIYKRYQILYRDESISIEVLSHCKGVNVRADKSLLIRIFDNIVKNAVEASPDSSKIKINASEDKGIWFVEIADQGNGVEEGNEKQIFDPFFTTKSKGTGLGLALVYQIVKAHNGLIYVANSVEGGAVFTLEIPVI